MHTEIDSPELLSELLSKKQSLDRVVFQCLDLRLHTPQILTRSLKEAVFLGCQLDPEVIAHANAQGALIFPEIAGIPFRPYRSTLYTVDELMVGYIAGKPETFWKQSTDAKIYQHFIGSKFAQKVPIMETLAQRIHDQAIDDTLTDFLLRGPAGKPHPVVAVMGGHRLTRTSAPYASVARITRALSREGYLVATGGGPGAMEAGHLGAWFSGAEDEALEPAIHTLAKAPTYEHPAWFESAMAVRERVPCGSLSLAIPTWFYGHEPTNLFASHVAKYFSNSLREDGLLGIAKHGVIYAPGSAGTVQEIFMDVCQNHYVTPGVVSPMVFFDKHFWTNILPLIPLVKALAERKVYNKYIHYTDDENDAVQFIRQHPPFKP